ncbi:hypothetical protein SCALM49S_00304 [Streptomyces californicus]
MPEYVDDSWRLGAGEPYTLNCGMRLLTENFRDKAHFPFVHADSMGHVDKVVEPYRISRDGWRLGWSSSLGSEGVPEDLAEELSHRLDYHITMPVFASICVSSPSGGRRLVAQVATPISADGKAVRQFWLAGTDAESTAQGAVLADVLGFERQVFEEDHPISGEPVARRGASGRSLSGAHTRGPVQHHLPEGVRGTADEFQGKPVTWAVAT